MIPNVVTSFFNDHRDHIWNGVLAFLGAVGNIKVHEYAGTELTTTQKRATIFCGTLMGVTGATVVGSYWNIDPTKAGGIGLCAVILGAAGIGIFSQLVNVKLPFSFFRKGDSE